ncbi:MAG: serine/threonine-protein phosphatase [Ruminococcaceae bacterium]|nr:serine/threonine-protein phosphatase [Oscillospiraceae bacterium]
MIYFGKTDKGLVRSENQDFFKCVEFSDVLVCVVCDGMGGMSWGEVASEVAAESFCSKFNELSQNYINNPLAYGLSMVSIIKRSIEFANESVYEQSVQNGCTGEMGTTLVCSVLYNNTLYSANVGDSRLYVLQDDALTRVTKDHSYVQLLIDMKMIDEKDSEKYDNNAITRGVGLDKEVEIDTYVMETADDSVYLLCSDGLYKMVSHEDIKETLGQINNGVDASYVVNSLIEKSIAAGGLDNTTAVIIQA